MKKFMKTSMIIAAIILAAGLCISLTGMVTGGSIIDMAKNNGFSLIMNKNGLSSWNEGRKTQEYAYDTDNAAVMDIQVGAGNVYYKVSDSAEYITVKTYGNHEYYIFAENSRLTIRPEIEWTFFNFNLFGGENYVEITVPKSYVATGMYVNLAAGSFEGDTMNVNGYTDISVSAGDFRVHTLDTLDLKVKVSAGSMEIANTKVKEDLYAKVSAGDATINGIDIQGNVELDVSAGSLDVGINGSQNHFQLQLQTGVGEINVDDMEFSGLGQTYTMNNQASQILKAKVSAGDININFN